MVYVWCTREDWDSPFFDIDYLMSEVGTYDSHEEAEQAARSCGETEPIILSVD